MNNELKKLLAHCLNTEGELRDFCTQCLREIFKEDYKLALSIFEEDCDYGVECNGCFQGLEYYKTSIKQSKETVAKYTKQHQELIKPKKSKHDVELSIT